jgi:hypothetical protein
VKFPFHAFSSRKLKQIEFYGTDTVSLKQTTFGHPLLGIFTFFVMNALREFIQDDTSRRTGVEQSLWVSAFV